MSIVKEFYKTRKDGVNLYRTYSDEGYILHKMNTDEFYTEAIDVENASYEYEETIEKIEFEEEPTELEQNPSDWEVGR